MIRRAANVAGHLAGLATLAIVLIVTYDIFMRSVLGQPQLFTDEVGSFLQVILIFSGAAYTFLAGGHVRVDLVTGAVRPATRARLRVLTLVLGLAFLAIVIWVTTQSAVSAYRYGRVSAVMLYPLWLPMAFIPAGLTLLALAMAQALVRQVRRALGPGADEVSPDEAG